jgi:hypothetical protein
VSLILLCLVPVTYLKLVICRQWREKQAEEIAARDARSKEKRQETIARAEQSIDQFYEEYNAKKERTIRENKFVPLLSALRPPSLFDPWSCCSLSPFLISPAPFVVVLCLAPSLLKHLYVADAAQATGGRVRLDALGCAQWRDDVVPHHGPHRASEQPEQDPRTRWPRHDGPHAVQGGSPSSQARGRQRSWRGGVLAAHCIGSYQNAVLWLGLSRTVQHAARAMYARLLLGAARSHGRVPRS